MVSLTGDWALTTDSQIAGVHFPPSLSPEVVARRLLAVNLSDLAAVGARPALALLALAAPPEWPLRDFFRGLRRAARQYGVVLAGGDLATSPTLMANLTLLGRRPPRGRWLRRDAARVGDRLWLGGTLGESAAGQLLVARDARWVRGRVTLPASLHLTRRERTLARAAVRRHLLPEPQLELGEWLGRRRRASCIDLSDGFSLDLHRLLEASGVGAEVDAAALPVSPGLERLAAHLGEAPLSLALGGGEDYALLFTLSKGLSPPVRFGSVPVGWIVARLGVDLVSSRGREPLPVVGWDHLR